MSYAWSARPATDTDMTSVLDGRTHTIAAADLDAGIWHCRGQYRAICGATVVAAALASAPGPGCVSCSQAVEAAQVAAAEQERQRRVRWPIRAMRRLRISGSPG